MTPREIIAEAWAITKREKLIRRWGFSSSFLETLFATKLLLYQMWFLYSYLKGNPIGFFDDFIWLYEHVSLDMFLFVAVFFVVLLAIEWLFPNLARGAVIGLTAKAYTKEDVRGGLVLGLYNFFPMVGIHELFVLAKIANIITLTSLTLRYVSGDVKFFMIAILVFFWLFSNILKFMASFAEPAVVVKRVSVFHGLGTSFKLIISYLGHVMFLWLLLFVISIRVMINAVIVLGITAIIAGAGFLLLNVIGLSFALVLTIILCLGLALILTASYFFTYLHVFNEAVWTITYFELKKQKDLLVIEG